MLWIDTKYVKLISPRLERWKLKSDTGNYFLANCRCPICGDSKSNKRKARGYFYSHEGELFYKCWNCDASMHFSGFLKWFDSNTYHHYALEKFKKEVYVPKAPPTIKKEKTYVPDIFADLKKISELDDEHPAKKYVLSRLIPQKFWNKLFYAPRYFKWSMGHTDKFEKVNNDPEKYKLYEHPRLIIPWYDEHNNVFGYHARAFGAEEPKYISIMIDKEKPRVFGLDRLDKSKPVFVVEGPLDSLFLDNAVAVGSSSLNQFTLPDAEMIYMFDQQPRNPEIVKLVGKAVRTGKKVVLLSEDEFPWKDINEAVQSGLDKNSLHDLLLSHVVHGLTAELKFNEWRKV